jgi:quercetin dioxygenase-like cupin family protein
MTASNKRITVVSVAFSMIAGVCIAQQPAFKRTELQRGDLTAGGREAVMAVAEIPAGVASGRHTHPGEEIGYVLEGPLVVEIDGQAPRTLKTGEAFLIPNGRVHNARNSGSGTARVLATYIVEKGKPVATPVQSAPPAVQ